jgi:D-alanine-D-alanine ligase
VTKKLRVGILFGGRSGEHEVSLLSAASILKAIDRTRFEVVPIGITKAGRWLAGEAADDLLLGSSSNATAGALATKVHETLPAHEPDSMAMPRSAALTPEPQGVREIGNTFGGFTLDIIFPVLHGTFGEDGTIQGLFELADIPYVGSGVLGSSVGMDKDVMKRLFAAADLPIVKHLSVLRTEWESSPRKIVAQIESALKYPLFVKPANLGSSVGISKAHNRSELGPALTLAAKYDRKLVIEQGVGGAKKKARELEVAVLGNDAPRASVVGEIIPGKEFYDYEDKYLSEGSQPVIPAKITKAESREIRALAVEAFKACDLSGLARVDFLMEPDGKKRIFLNEVNTMPGFTKISMYPKLWEANGVSYTALITELIELALNRHAEKKRTVYTKD